MTRIRRPVLSIVTPVWARRRQLTQLLASLAAQQCRAGLFEVVIVDNPWRYNQRWLNDSEWPFPVRYECLPVANRGRSRNLGASRAATDWLLFADSDVTFAPDAVDCLLQAVTAKPTTIIMADVVFPPGQPRTLGTHLFDVAAYFRSFRRKRRLGQLTFREFVSCAFVVSRAGFERTGRFDEGFHHYGYEDVDFAWRAQTTGLSFELATTKAYHNKRLDPQVLLRQAIETGRSAVHLVRRHPTIESVLPVGVADTRSGVLSYSADFDVTRLIASANDTERRWARTRRGDRQIDVRGLLAEAEQLYREIARFGRFTGIVEELSNDTGAVQ